MRRNARGKGPVGGHQRRGQAFGFDRFSQRDGNRLGLARRIGQLGDADAGQASLGARQMGPFIAIFGGGHGVTDGAPADRIMSKG